MFRALPAAVLASVVGASGGALPQPDLDPGVLGTAAVGAHRSPAGRHEFEAAIEDKQDAVFGSSALEDDAITSRLPGADVKAIRNGVRGAAGRTKGTILVTITTGGMVDFAKNMLTSLGAVDDRVSRLVVGMGINVCMHFESFAKTSCVEVFRRDMNSSVQVPWGSREYWRVVFRKHVVLTVIASSGLSDSIVFSDPDVVFLDSPVAHFTNLSRRSENDVTFSLNNMLEPNATSIEDLAIRYNTNGMPNITLGAKHRHADINSGLFHMVSGPSVAEFFLRTVKILKEEEFQHGHYQQFCLVKALGEVPGVKIGVASGLHFVNGNVFWGHRGVLDPRQVVSVHANWMQQELKRSCLKAAGLWFLEDDAANTTVRSGTRRVGGPQWLSIERAPDRAIMDSRGATVLECSGPDEQQPEAKAKISEEPARGRLRAGAY